MRMGWSEVNIGEVVAPVRRLEEPIAGRVYRQIGVRLWGAGAYEREPLDGASTRYKRLSRVNENDIIVNKIWARNGSVSVVTKELAGCYCSGEFPLFVPFSDRLHPKWFYWMTKTRWFWNKCDLKSRGTSGKNRIRPEEFLSIEIPLPSLSEQRRIVAKIDQVAAKIEEVFKLKKAVIDLCEKMLAGVFHRIVDKVPYLPMENVAPLVRRPVDVQPNAVYLELGVRSFGNGTFHKPALPGLEVGTKRLYRIEAGDIVLSNVFAWEGGIAVAKKEDSGRVGSHRFITRVTVSTKATANFIKYYLLTPEGLEKIGKASPGGAGRNRTLGLKKLDAIEVPIPSMEKQCYFDRLVDKVEALKAFHGITVPQINAVIPKLLNAVFASGG